MRGVAVIVLVSAALGCGAEFGAEEGTAASGGGGGATSATTTTGGGGASSTDGGAGGFTTTSAVGGGGGAGGGGAGAGGGAVGCTEGLEVTAAVADCVKHLMPDPDYCETQVSANPTGVGEMDVDESRDSTTGNIARAYFHFDLPNDALGASAFTLRLVNTGIGNADSPGSGAVRRVEPFARSDLFVGPPATVGNELAGDQGAVALNETVDWALPATVIDNGSVFLELRGTDANGVRYWNNNSNFPPKLIVSCP